MNYLIIPAYQPDLNLVKLVRLVHAKSDLHIIVVDDGSDADKKVIFDKLEGLATVLTHEHNQVHKGANRSKDTKDKEEGIQNHKRGSIV